MFATATIEKVVARCLGRKPKTADNLARGIAAEEAAIAAARSTIESAKVSRQTAIEDFDATAHKKADEDISEAEREIERRQHAIEALKAAHCARVDVETREALWKEVATLEEEGEVLRKRLQTDYAPAAGTIAKIVADLAAFQARQKALLARGKQLGEVVSVSDPEDFRGAPVKKQWSASWLAPEGGYTISGGVEDAPRGSIKWENGEPISKRSDVQITRFRVVGGGQPPSLVESVGDLPELKVGEGFFHNAYNFEPPMYVPLADRLKAQ